DGLRRFDPGRLQVFGRDASWVLLWPGEGDWPQAPFVLEIEGAGLQALTLHGPGPGVVRTTQSTRGEQAWPAHGHLAFAIAEAPAPGELLRLRIDAAGVGATPASLGLRPTVDYLRADAGWLAFASACRPWGRCRRRPCCWRWAGAPPPSPATPASCSRTRPCWRCRPATCSGRSGGGRRHGCCTWWCSSPRRHRWCSGCCSSTASRTW